MKGNQIVAELKAAGIDVEQLEHEAVFTVEDSAAVHEALPASHTKNLFLKDKRGGFWLIVLPSERRADLKAMAETLGASKFSFAKPDDMARLLCVVPGAVTPLAACNAGTGDVRVVFDAAFQSTARIAVHPLRNTATVALSFESLVTWLSSKGVNVQVSELL